MRLQDRIDSSLSIDRKGKILCTGDIICVLGDCKAAADVVEAISIALKIGCSGNEILEKGSAIRLAIEAIMEQSK